MKHISHADLILCAMNEMALIDALPEKERHLKECNICSRQIDDSAKQLQAYQVATHQECEEMSNLLIDHLIQTPDLPFPPILKRHRDECYECRILAREFQKLPTFEEFQAQNISYTDELFAEVDAQVARAVKQWQRAPKPSRTKQKLEHTLQNLIKIFNVESFPIPAPSMVRGSSTNKYEIFSHRGGSLQLNTGIPDKKVKLYAIFNGKIYEEKTDTLGQVIFKDLIHDDYRIEIEGYEVKNVKAMIVGD